MNMSIPIVKVNNYELRARQSASDSSGAYGLVFDNSVESKFIFYFIVDGQRLERISSAVANRIENIEAVINFDLNFMTTSGYNQIIEDISIAEEFREKCVEKLNETFNIR